MISTRSMVFGNQARDSVRREEVAVASPGSWAAMLSSGSSQAPATLLPAGTVPRALKIWFTIAGHYWLRGVIRTERFGTAKPAISTRWLRPT